MGVYVYIVGMDRGDEKAIEKLDMRATPTQKRMVRYLAKRDRRSVSEWLRLRLELCLEQELKLHPELERWATDPRP